jgi:uncharacterized protein
MFGIGLRTAHYTDFLNRNVHGIDFVEAITENFATRHGRPRAILRSVREHFPIVFHGVSMSVGGIDELNWEYLAAIKQLAEDFEPLWISDHLCFGTSDGHYSHDLWPLPRTQTGVDRSAERIKRVQDFLGRQILIENVSTYIEFAADEMSEAEFVYEVASLADCYLLLDVNNVVVNAHNHGFIIEEYLDTLPMHRVKQLHIAGHSDHGTYLFDNHQGPVPAKVWNVYESVISRIGTVPTLVEWDTDVPAVDVVVGEATRAREIAARYALDNAP